MAKTIVPHRAEYKIGDYIVGDLKVVSSLGEGSFGHVYKVQNYVGTVYALKLLRLWDVPSDIREPLVERFEMEFKTGQIDSPYLVHSIDYGFVNGNPYIVMDYCSGGDLTAYVGKRGIDLPTVASNILHGLYALHKNGKVHRDLKPENILFKENGNAALTDFGIAGDRTRRMTERSIFGKPHQIFGTYGYMPPEQVNPPRGGKACVLPTTDIFSFGVVIYQILTGRLPFGKLEDQNDLVLYIKRGKTGDWNRDLLLNTPHGRLWEVLIEGCLQPNFEKRIQNVYEVHKLIPRYVVNCETSKPLMNMSYNQHPQTEKKGFSLRVMHGDDYGNVFDLTLMKKQAKEPILGIGRNRTNQILLNDRYVSRFHSTLKCNMEGEKEMWCIYDGQMIDGQWRNSSNGICVNSTKVKSYGFWLKNGDIISIGDTKLRYEQY